MVQIGELIVVNDVSTTPVEQYYACPHYFFKMDVISAQFLREEKWKRKEEPPVKTQKEKGEYSNNIDSMFIVFLCFVLTPSK